MALPWLSNVTRRLRPPRRRRPHECHRRFRPLLEVLEDRCLLATVTTLLDRVSGSLREAIALTEPGGTVDFAPGLSGTITLATPFPSLSIDKDLTIAGPGADVVTVNGNRGAPVFDIVAYTVTVAISGLTITNGGGGVGAGGIRNFGTLAITNCTISGNSSIIGGIENGGTMTVTGSVISGNSASFVNSFGGGIFNGGTMTVTGSVISGNSADLRGGGIVNGGTMTVIDSIVSGNSAGRLGGGGISNEAGTLTIINSIISGNRNSTTGSSDRGAGIQNLAATLHITGSTVSGNSAGFFQAGGISNVGGTLTITGSSISGNDGGQGGIRNVSGMSSITGSTVSGNSGGGISNAGTLSVASSTISGNHEDSGAGAGIFTNSGALTVTGSTVTGNSTGSVGGGIASAGGTATIASSTVSGNSAGSLGGGIYTNPFASLTLTGSTVSGNSAGSSGGGIFLEGGLQSIPPIIRNTILAGNEAPLSPDVAGTLDSQGHNLIGVGDGGSDFYPTDLVGTAAFPIDPLLEPLGDYGGPTQTHRPLPGSPAINAGDNAGAPATDQRGFGRIVLGFLDIGAVELQPNEFAGPAPPPVPEPSATDAVFALLAENEEGCFIGPRGGRSRRGARAGY